MLNAFNPSPSADVTRPNSGFKQRKKDRAGRCKRNGSLQFRSETSKGPRRSTQFVDRREALKTHR